MSAAVSDSPPADGRVCFRRINEEVRENLLRENVPAAAAAVLSARDGIASKEDITPPLASLPKPQDILPQTEELSALLSDAINGNMPIRVVGDYDADGMSSTALAVDCLSRLGASVTWRIPDRVRHGYGLHAEIADEAAADGCKVLLTVDNGIAAHAAVAHAKKLGLRVCITDHHLPDDGAPPDADCIVNPQCVAEPGAGINLAGVGVAFYALAALRARMGRDDIRMNDYLDLVAVGTVADCVQLDKLNRALVGGGLSILREGRGRAGIAALLKSAKLSSSALTCRDISYKLAPRINSAGRLQRAELSVELLLADSPSAAEEMTRELENINRERVERVTKAMKNLHPDLSLPGIVIADESFPPGITGILAGRLAERHNRPAVVFSRNGEHWRGSGRVPKGDWDLHALVTAAAEAAGDAVLQFGGHHKAVGISARAPEEFAQAFVECCRHDPPPPPKKWVDALPPVAELTTEALSYMGQIAWGEGFPQPLFFADGEVSNIRALRGGCHWRFDFEVDGRRLPALAFNRNEEPWGNINAVFSLMTDARSGVVTAVIEEII